MAVQQSAFSLSVESALESVQNSLKEVASAADNNGTINMKAHRRLLSWLKTFELNPSNGLLSKNVAEICAEGIVAIRTLVTELEADGLAAGGAIRLKACAVVMRLDCLREQYFRSGMPA